MEGEGREGVMNSFARVLAQGPHAGAPSNGYDAANQLTSLTYAQGSTTLVDADVHLRCGGPSDQRGRDVGAHRAAAGAALGEADLKAGCGDKKAPAAIP